MKPSVLIDLDYTLFDPSSLHSDHQNFTAIKSFVASSDDLTSYLYPDAIPFLNSLLVSHIPILFTEGEPKFQRQKFIKSGLARFFDKTHLYYFTPDSKLTNLERLINQYHPAALIDDKPKVIDHATSLGLPTIRLVRGKYKDSQPKHAPSFTVSSLEDITANRYLEVLEHPYTNSQHFHLIGIKGVGMTALALCLSDMGKSLTGSDSKTSQITDQTLRERHIPVFPWSPDNITQTTDLVIYSGAYQESTHKELAHAAKLNTPRLPLASALGHLVQGKTQIAVSGVGGKTTTSAMLASIFDQAHQAPSWFVGTSRLSAGLPPGKFGPGRHFIIEADEYAIRPGIDNRPKFSLYDPQLIICTNLVHDHPDIYPSFSDTLETFINFFKKLPQDGLLLINHHTQGLTAIRHALKSTPIQTFGTHPQADWLISGSGTSFSISHHSNHYLLTLKVPGLINAFNATAALATATYFGLDQNLVLDTLSNFSGTKRRLELIAHKNHIYYYDDYAHHPGEISGALEAIKSIYPNRRLLVVFHPHTYSRTKALIKDFATSFGLADQVIVTKIFSSAREKRGDITGQDLAEYISYHHKNVKFLATFSQIADHLNRIKQPSDVILTLGAGDIYKLHKRFIKK